MMIIIDSDDDGASGSMIRALANHHSSIRLTQQKLLGGRIAQSHTDIDTLIHYTVRDTQRHRHTDRESCEGKDTHSYTDRPNHTETHIQRRNSQFIIDLIDLLVTLIQS